MGKEHLVPQTLVLVERGEWGARVWPLAAHDDAGAVPIASQLDHPGQFGDLGAGTE
ncbi:hypothetical protein ACFWWM_13605 [Streptomyces sp. NPDC058682]|uniref:hypothetical protein n=1 Tax=Streptomyces sp. NPDC058682 TaxID=3346596 RepID=UPI00364B2806